jgi:polyhydroxyalkanoate synthase
VTTVKPPARPSLPSPGELLGRIRGDVERSALRARNGLKYLGGVDRPQVGQTPKDVVFRRHKAELWHYRSDQVTHQPPVLIVMSLISRSYILDLAPGNSFVSRLRDEGLDVYMLDWGIPDEADADNTFETYIDDYLPKAVDAVLERSGTPNLTILGYCFGGLLSVLYAARHHDAPLRNLVVMATPTDFSKMGLQAEVFRAGNMDPDAVIDASGNVPPEAIRSSFRLLKPTGDAASYATLWQNLWSDEHMAAYQAMSQWTKDHIPFPGAIFRQNVDMMRDNAIMEGKLELGGEPVHLASITCPFLNVLADKDHIVPGDAASPLVGLVGSEEAEELRLPAGHVGLVAGRSASKQTIPVIVDWIKRHSDAKEGEAP